MDKMSLSLKSLAERAATDDERAALRWAQNAYAYATAVATGDSWKKDINAAAEEQYCRLEEKWVKREAEERRIAELKMPSFNEVSEKLWEAVLRSTTSDAAKLLAMVDRLVSFPEAEAPESTRTGVKKLARDGGAES